MIATPLSRICKGCDEMKPIDEFYRHEKSLGGRRRKCRTCIAEGVRKRIYGVSLSEVCEMQGSSDCAICGEEAMCIDHDHATGLVRGALCRRCNVGLHYLENEEWRTDAARYLEECRKAREDSS